MMTKAEQRARKVEESVLAKTEILSDGSPRFQASVRFVDQETSHYSSGEVMLPATKVAYVTLYDGLTGGSMWFGWRSVTEGRKRTTRFLGGDYNWVSAGKTRKVRSERTLGSLLATFLST